MQRLAALILTLTLPLTAQTGSWEQVSKLRPGERIWVDYQKNGKPAFANGRMGAWTPENLSLQKGKREIVVPRNDVRKIRVYAGKSRKRGAAIGAAIAAPIGAGIGGIAASVSEPGWGLGRAGATLILIALYTGIGALIGLGVGRTRTETVYSSK